MPPGGRSADFGYDPARLGCQGGGQPSRLIPGGTGRRTADAVRVHAQARPLDRAHDRAREAGRGRGVRVRLAVRLARPVAGSVPAADPHRRGDDDAPPRDLRHQPGDPRAVRHGVDARGPQRAVRRADGPGHRPRRLRAARPGQAADVDEGPRAGGARHPGARRGPLDRVRGHDARAALVARASPPRLDRRLRPGRAQAHRADRRRVHAPDRRPGPRPLVRVPGPRVGARGRPRPRQRQGDGRRPGPRRRPRRRPRPDPLVPRPRLATTSSTWSTSTRARTCPRS